MKVSKYQVEIYQKYLDEVETLNWHLPKNLQFKEFNWFDKWFNSKSGNAFKFFKFMTIGFLLAIGFACVGGAIMLWWIIHFGSEKGNNGFVALMLFIALPFPIMLLVTFLLAKIFWSFNRTQFLELKAFVIHLVEENVFLYEEIIKIPEFILLLTKFNKININQKVRLTLIPTEQLLTTYLASYQITKNHSAALHSVNQSINDVSYLDIMKYRFRFSNNKYPYQKTFLFCGAIFQTLYKKLQTQQ